MRSLFAAALVATLLLAPQARAEEKQSSRGAAAPARVEAFARYGMSWISDPGFKFVSEDDHLPRVEIGLGYRPEWLGEDLAFELGYGFGWSQSLLFGVADTRLELHSILGAANYTFSRHWLARAYVGAGAELAFAHLRVEEFSRSSQTTTVLGLQGILGYELAIPLDPDDGAPTGPGLRLSVEAGYGLFPFDADFDDLRYRPADEMKPAPIPSSAVAPGTLDLSGWILRFGAGFRF